MVLTAQMCAERGHIPDLEGAEEALAKHKESSRKVSSSSFRVIKTAETTICGKRKRRRQSFILVSYELAADGEKRRSSSMLNSDVKSEKFRKQKFFKRKRLSLTKGRNILFKSMECNICTYYHVDMMKMVILI